MNIKIFLKKNTKSWSKLWRKRKQKIRQTKFKEDRVLITLSNENAKNKRCFNPKWSLIKIKRITKSMDTLFNHKYLNGLNKKFNQAF